jgi:hypothetical protein
MEFWSIAYINIYQKPLYFMMLPKQFPLYSMNLNKEVATQV